MQINVGIEIELIHSDYFQLFKALVKNNIYFIFSPQQCKSSTNQLLIKPEITVLGGIELNIPPTYTYSQLQKLCNILINIDCKFNHKCALHIHFTPNKEIPVENYINYYIEHQTDIINDAKQQKLYINLNKELIWENHEQRQVNLNTKRSIVKHGTIEHRIYKATVDYNEILGCINQTKKIRDLI